MEIFQLTSLSPDPVNADPVWLKKHHRTIICPKCHTINKAYYPKPVHIRLFRKPGSDEACAGVFYVGIVVVATKLVGALEKWLEGFVLGECLDREGALIITHRTCYSDKRVLIRADRQLNMWTCDVCGQVGSYAPQTVPRYVYRDEMAPREVQCTTSGSLLVSSTVASYVDWSQWPQLELSAISVRERPANSG
jgi:hypothetical protein